MATQAQLDILNQAQKYAGAFNQARTKKNPFGQSKVDPGRYLWHCARLALGQGGKKGKKVPALIFQFVCQAAENGDRKFFGEQFRVTRYFGPTENASAEENSERLMYSLQEIGVETDLLELTANAVELPKFNILQLLDYVASAPLYCWGDIVEGEPNSQGQRFKNLNNVTRAADEELLAVLGEGNFIRSDQGMQDASQGDPVNAGGGEVVEDADYADADYEGGEGEAGTGEAEATADKFGNAIGTLYTGPDGQTYPATQFDDAGVFCPPPPPPQPAPVAAPKPAPAPAPAVAQPAAAQAPQYQQFTPPAAAPAAARPASMPGANPAATKAPTAAPNKRVGPPKRS